MWRARILSPQTRPLSIVRRTQRSQTDVQQSIPSSRPSQNDVEQCTLVYAEPPKMTMESPSTEHVSLIGYVQNLSLLKRNR